MAALNLEVRGNYNINIIRLLLTKPFLLHFYMFSKFNTKLQDDSWFVKSSSSIFQIFLKKKENLEVTQNVVLSRNVLKTRGLHFKQKLMYYIFKKHIEIKNLFFLLWRLKDIFSRTTCSKCIFHSNNEMF